MLQHKVIVSYSSVVLISKEKWRVSFRNELSKIKVSRPASFQLPKLEDVIDRWSKLEDFHRTWSYEWILANSEGSFEKNQDRFYNTHRNIGVDSHAFVTGT